MGNLPKVTDPTLDQSHLSMLCNFPNVLISGHVALVAGEVCKCDGSDLRSVTFGNTPFWGGNVTDPSSDPSH